MSNYELYGEILASAGEGTPLWEPAAVSSPHHHTPSVGDVGYLRCGAFVRLFNAMLPPGHPDNENGEPPDHDPLVVDFASVRRVLPPGVVAAVGVETTGASQNEAELQMHFRCTAKAGALVMASSEVHRQDVATPSLGRFADYAVAHASKWAQFARHHLMHEVAMHELILVTGCDITKDRYSVTVFNSVRISRKIDSSFRLPHPASDFYSWSHSPAIGHFQHNYGPRSPRTTQQCLFIRGFKVLNRRSDQLERQERKKSFVESICASQSRGPLDAVLSYLADKSDAGVAVAHDYDLIRLLGKPGVLSCDYRTILKSLKKTRRSIISRGSAALLS